MSDTKVCFRLTLKMSTQKLKWQVSTIVPDTIGGAGEFLKIVKDEDIILCSDFRLAL